MVRNFFKESSIFKKILIIAVATAIISLSFLLFFSIRQQRTQIKNSIITQHKDLAATMSKVISSGYYSGNIPYRSLKKITQSKGIYYWWIVDSEGKIYQASNVSSIGKSVSLPSPENETVVKDSIYYKTGEPMKLFVHPLEIEGNSWRFVIGVSLKPVRKATNETIKSSLLVFGFATLIAIGLSYYGSRKIVKPINKLDKLVQEVMKGNMREIEVESGDEIGNLAESFNKMTRSLERTIDAYEAQIKELEKE